MFGIERGTYDICRLCGWEDDPVQEADHEYPGGANKLSVNEYRRQWQGGLQRKRKRRLP